MESLTKMIVKRSFLVLFDKLVASSNDGTRCFMKDQFFNSLSYRESEAIVNSILSTKALVYFVKAYVFIK
ncbi:hypothetical protein HMPREF0548_1966 [Lactobacillus ultunensis DSM 16047]|uniref:Uncharacterized protein n=1 Tax=Lactobacillus ultunensis DSM 16047 TaxID=525365 RepID=C2EQM0_9LACO|nr:hypothetical protein HMPREF0548_1966 [Lactobacillus ultunensis DSM 16047]